MLICGYVARRGINTPGLAIAIIVTLWEQCFNRSSETREETLSRDHLPITWVMHQSHELMCSFHYSTAPANCPRC